MEHQLHELISKEEDLIHYPDKVYSLLSRNNLLPDNDENRQHEQPKFIAIFDYLLENAQIYAILKAIWKLNVENTSLISDHSLKTVLDWSWSKVSKIKIELNILRKTLGCHALTANWSQPPPLDSDQLDSFLSRASSLLEGLIQIYKQFIKLETTSREGHAQLNKRLCIIESMKFYVEHLVLFHKFEMLLAPPRPHTSPQKAAAAQDNVVVTHRNYLSEMHINFAIIEKRWITRRQQQDELLNAIATTGDNSGDGADVIYPFTYLIDCLFEECRAFANVAQLFHPGKTNDERDNETFVGGYPPKSLIELLDICLECNIGTKMKQIIILYVLCDLMHTEFSSAGQKHILKLINAYCSNTFTIMSTQLDSVLSVPWSTSSTSIVSVGSDGADPNNSSCLFDLVNGFYLIDSRIADKAFKYLRATDLNYLEFYEKYFILYNTMSVKDHKTAAQYLWLFQKLNANSIVSATNDLTSGASVIENELGLFRFMAKSGTGNSVNELNKLKHEQKMHARLFLTIYLANQLVNEAYNLVKPHLKNVKSVLKTPSLSSHPGVKFSKELLIHFFLQVDRYNQWKHVNELTSQDKDLLLVMFNFLEASNKLSLICMAIDLHVNSQNYNKAIELYDRYAKQIVNSKYSYLATMVEIAREVHTEYTADDEDEFSALKYSLITSQDIKETQNFENKFTVSLRELCKNSKRCINLLSRPEDEVYINLLKMPSSIEASETSSSNQQQQQQRQVKFCSSTTKLPSSESTNSLPSHTPYKLTLTPAEATRTPIRKSILANNDHHHLEDDYGDSPKRRKPSTPHPTRGVFKFTSEEEEEEEAVDEDKDEAEDKGKDDIEEEMNEIKETPAVDTVTTTATVTKETTPPPKRSPKLKPPMSENNRVLTSSLRISRVMGAASAAKSVKFSAVKHTRNFCGVNVNVDMQEKMDLDEETNVEEKPKRDVHKKLVFADDDANNGGAKTRASLKPVRKEELRLSPEVDEDDKNDDDYKPKSSLSLKKPTFTTTTTIMTRRSQICSSEEIRKSLNEIADNNPKRKSLPNSRRSTSEQPPKREQQQAEEEEPITEITSVPPTSPPRDSTAQSQSLAAKAVSPIMSFVASMSERIVASLSPRAATEVVENATETVSPGEQKKSPSTSKSPDKQVKDSPAATRKSFFSMLGFNLTPRSNEKQPKETEVSVEEKKPDNDIEVVLDTSEETSTSSSPPVSPARSSIKITPKKKPTEETSSHPLMKCSTSVELAPHASEELTTARMSPIRPSTSRAEAMKLSEETSSHPLMKCSTSVELAPHASEELTTARMSPIRPSTSRAEAMKLSEEPSIETADTPMDQDIVEIDDEEEKTAKASEDDDLVSLDEEEDEEEEIETRDEPIVTATTTTTTIEIKYLTETELEERKAEEANNEDYQYDLLDSLNGRKNTIRFTQVDEVATQSHRVEQVEPVVESTEPVVESTESVAEPTEQVVEVTATTEPVVPVVAPPSEPAVDLNETLERENNDDENEGEKQAEEEKQQEESTDQTPTKTAITKEESFNMSSVSHDGDANVNQDEPTTKKSPVIQLSPTTAAQPNEEFAIPRMSRTNSESSLFSQISSVSEHYEKMKRQEAEQKAAAAAVEEEEEDEKRNEKGSKLKRGRQVSLRSSTRPTISTRAAATTRSHHMDDDELKKTSEEVLSSRKTSAKGSIVRRRSDLSSASSAASAVSSRNHQAVAKLAENIPESFGTSENEVRLTRSKLKNLLVREEDGETEEEKSTVGEDEEKSASAAPPTTTTTRLTRRNSRRQQQPAQPQPHLEQVNENEELSTAATSTSTATRMSAYNLKKHNAAMDKLNDESHEDAAKRAKKPPVSTGRVTRSAKTTRSPSPTASSVISASSVVSSVARSAISVASTSTTASQQTKRRGRPPRAPLSTPTLSVGDNEQDKTLKADEDENEENESHNSPDICLELSPNGSQVSTAMSEATGRQRMTRRRAAAAATSSTTAQPVKRSATPPNSSSSTQRAALVSRSYSLRSKAPPTKNRDDDSVTSELCPLDEVIKPQQVAKKSTRGTRARKSLNTESESVVDESASSIVSEQTNEPDEIETLVKRTRSRAKKSPVKEDEEHEVKSKLTRTESEEEKFKFSNPRNVTYGTSKSSKKGSAASAKFEFSPPSPIKK